MIGEAKCTCDGIPLHAISTYTVGLLRQGQGGVLDDVFHVLFGRGAAGESERSGHGVEIVCFVRKLLILLQQCWSCRRSSKSESNVFD